MQYRFLLRLPRLHAAGQVLTSLRLGMLALAFGKCGTASTAPAALQACLRWHALLAVPHS